MASLLEISAPSATDILYNFQQRRPFISHQNNIFIRKIYNSCDVCFINVIVNSIVLLLFVFVVPFVVFKAIIFVIVFNCYGKISAIIIAGLSYERFKS